MYFVRSQVSDVWTQIYKAQNSGDYINFSGSAPLGPQINNIYGNQKASYPSLTQDGQKLYFCTGATHWQIYEATWNGTDWDNVSILPSEVNGIPGEGRSDVCITPDGNEIYFAVNSGKLAFSQKSGGVWQQWQYCDENVNGPNPNVSVTSVGITSGNYFNQELYYTRVISSIGTKYHSLRSPVTVQPASIGQIKANYAR